MAGFAIGFLRIGMGPDERKVRARMVERRLVDRGNILPSPFMLCVAVVTFPLLCHPAMKFLFTFDVLPDIFVAILTKL